MNPARYKEQLLAKCNKKKNNISKTKKIIVVTREKKKFDPTKSLISILMIIQPREGRTAINQNRRIAANIIIPIT